METFDIEMNGSYITVAVENSADARKLKDFLNEIEELARKSSYIEQDYAKVILAEEKLQG
jgi:hypothetical protein